MYFPSLSVFTTLACAALSIAAPITTPPNVNGVVAKVDDTIGQVRRDVSPASPAAPITPAAPLEITLNDLLNDLKPAVDALVQCADAQVAVKVDTAQVKVALLNIVTIIVSYTTKIKDAASESVDNVRATVVAHLMYQIVSIIVTALAIVAKAGLLVQDVVGTVVTKIGGELAAVITTVTTAVPAAVALIITDIRPTAETIVELNLASILEALGMQSPFS